jgi:hypothetical protein
LSGEFFFRRGGISSGRRKCIKTANEKKREKKRKRKLKLTPGKEQFLKKQNTQTSHTK